MLEYHWMNEYFSTDGHILAFRLHNLHRLFLEQKTKQNTKHAVKSPPHVFTYLLNKQTMPDLNFMTQLRVKITSLACFFLMTL